MRVQINASLDPFVKDEAHLADVRPGVWVTALVIEAREKKRDQERRERRGRPKDRRRE